MLTKSLACLSLCLWELVILTNIGGGYLDTTYYSAEIANLISSIIIYLCAFSLVIKTIVSKNKISKKAKKGGEQKC